MARFKLILTGAFLAVLTLYLVVFMLVASDLLQPVQADAANQFAAPAAVEEIHYAQLTDAQPQRDITQQHFAPLTEN
jgi:hypothetical protein